MFGSASIRRKPASKAHDFNALYAHREHSTKFSASCRHSEHTGRSQTAHPKKVLGVQRSHTIVSHSWHFLRGSLFNLWHSSHEYSPHSSQQSSSNAYSTHSRQNNALYQTQAPMGSSLPQSLQNMFPQLQQVAHASTSSPSIIVRKATV